MENRDKRQELALVYMVAGISSRFGGKIKQFAKIGPNDETLIEYSLKQALQAGFSKIIFVVSSKTEKPFKDFFGNDYSGVPIHYALQTYDENQRDCPWGTLDALCSARDLIDCPFIVCNGDDIYGTESFKILAEHLKNSEVNATVGYRLIDVIPKKGAVNRAIFHVDEKNCIRNLQEIFNVDVLNLSNSGVKPEDLCSLNIFAFHPETMQILKKQLEEFKEKNKNHRTAEALLPTEISKLIRNKQINIKVYPTSGKWYGVTNPEDEFIVREEIKKISEKLNNY